MATATFHIWRGERGSGGRPGGMGGHGRGRGGMEGGMGGGGMGGMGSPGGASINIGG